ncbi:peptidylprolyl isomerase [Saccharophagus sp. K07]|jgi:FKBP-type peptidyl-prolyl cis-trans isomerase SlyD|uniref:FKBP-type peptidyl-prolyl cis-trans isomerase n=1 Tax=Saccharophagus sp. K07 TaxID=2283636 RepID=UPI0016521D17|nr:peptidylprolyl isomerase [Saccharophagus sp. K07]MBC6906947.1 peptidylprolyl isomerase [Saccharophagus sp. K07]
MQIEKDKVVSILYQLKDAEGEQLEETQDGIPLAYLHGHNNLLPALEEALAGRQAGDKLSLTLPPEKAYGELKPGATQRVPIKHLVHAPKRLMPGMIAHVQTEQGILTTKILKVGKFNVDVDLNHPFAGKTLQFDIEVVSVRDASEEEIAHGHAHGDGGHHH